MLAGTRFHNAFHNAFRKAVDPIRPTIKYFCLQVGFFWLEVILANQHPQRWQILLVTISAAMLSLLLLPWIPLPADIRRWVRWLCNINALYWVLYWVSSTKTFSNAHEFVSSLGILIILNIVFLLSMSGFSSAWGWSRRVFHRKTGSDDPVVEYHDENTPIGESAHG